MWLRLTSLLLLTQVGCGQSESDLCASQQESYRVTASVRVENAASDGVPEPVERSASAGTLLVSVWESDSIASCEGDLVTHVHPGNSLISDVPVEAGAERFTVEIPATVYPELDTPELWMHVLFDENGNGACDDGEPMGGAAVQRVPDSEVHVVLTRQTCFARI